MYTSNRLLDSKGLIFLLYNISKNLISLIKNHISFYNIFKFISSLNLSCLLIYKFDLLHNIIINLFSLCIGMRSELVLLSDTIPILADQINAINSNINTILLHTNNNLNIINTHLYYQDSILNNFTTFNNVWSEYHEEMNNPNIIHPNTINRNILNTLKTPKLPNIETNVALYNPGLSLHLNPNPMNIIRVGDYNIPNTITNINPNVFLHMMNHNNINSMSIINHNNMIIKDSMDIIKQLAIRPNVDDQENLNYVNNRFEDNSIIGIVNKKISSIAFIICLLSVGALGGHWIKPATRIIISV